VWLKTGGSKIILFIYLFIYLFRSKVRKFRGNGGDKMHKNEGQINIKSNRHTLMTVPQITPWSRDVPEKLKGPQLVKKFPAFYGTRRFITAFTSARQLFLPYTRSKHSRPHPLTS
jgi:hypothetical protein